MRSLDYSRFKDKGFRDRLGLAGKGLSLLLEKGIYEGTYLRGWLAQQLHAQGVRTFADLRRDDPDGSLPPEEAFRLVVMASDVSRGCLARLPWDYARYGVDASSQEVADAVRMSMSIPFFYGPVKLAAEGRTPSGFPGDGGRLRGPLQTGRRLADDDYQFGCQLQRVLSDRHDPEPPALPPSTTSGRAVGATVLPASPRPVRRRTVRSGELPG